MTELNLGSLRIDLDVYRDSGLRIGVVGSSGSGKGYLTGVINEELHDAGFPLVALDPESELWTFQEVGALVLGGPHADAPLPWYWEWPAQTGRRAPDPVLHFDHDVTRQALEYAMDTGTPLIFDLGSRERIASWMLLEEGESIIAVFDDVTDQRRERVGFTAIEASLFAPQQVPGGGRAPEGLAGMAQRGRKRGVVSVVETQRAQDIQKRAISQCNIRLIGRLDSLDDYKVLKAYCGDRTFAQMKALPVGHFIFDGEEITVRERRVTHGGGTPGEGVVVAKKRTASAPVPTALLAGLTNAAIAPVPPTSGIDDANDASASPTRRNSGTTLASPDATRYLAQIAELERTVARLRTDATLQVEVATEARRQRDDARAQAEAEHDIITDLRVTFAKILGEGITTTTINMPDGTTFEGNGMTEADVLRLIREHAPTSAGVPAVQLAPVEKLRAGYLEQAAQRLLADLQALAPLERQVYEFLCAHPAMQGLTSIARALGRSGGGQQQQPVSNALGRLEELMLIEQYRSGNNRYYRPTPDKLLSVAAALKDHEPTADEVAQIRDRAFSILLAGA